MGTRLPTSPPPRYTRIARNLLPLSPHSPQTLNPKGNPFGQLWIHPYCEEHEAFFCPATCFRLPFCCQFRKDHPNSRATLKGLRQAVFRPRSVTLTARPCYKLYWPPGLLPHGAELCPLPLAAPNPKKLTKGPLGNYLRGWQLGMTAACCPCCVGRRVPPICLPSQKTFSPGLRLPVSPPCYVRYRAYPSYWSIGASGRSLMEET